MDRHQTLRRSCVSRQPHSLHPARVRLPYDLRRHARVANGQDTIFGRIVFASQHKVFGSFEQSDEPSRSCRDENLQVLISATRKHPCCTQVAKFSIRPYKKSNSAAANNGISRKPILWLPIMASHLISGKFQSGNMEVRAASNPSLRFYSRHFNRQEFRSTTPLTVCIF
jgi:hypothetical protein